MARIIKKRSTNSNETDLLKMIREQPDLFNSLMEYIKPDEQLVLKKQTNTVKLHSDNYMVIDTDILAVVQNKISESDYKRLFSLGVFLKTRYNILFNHTKPFTLESLSKQLSINKENTTKFVQRMVKEGIMSYTVCAPTGYIEKIYSINPLLIRRGKLYDKDFVKNYFRDFTQELNNNK